MKNATPTGAVRRAPKSTAVTASLNPGTAGLSFREQKNQKPVRSHVGYLRCFIGADRNGRDQFVLLRPDQIESRREKYDVLKPVETVNR